jgi:hypothetical protein
MNRQGINEVKDKYAKSRQECLIYLPVFCLEQVDEEKNKKEQCTNLIGIVELEYYPDKIIQQNTKS